MVKKNIIILYGVGGLSDVGRHAIWSSVIERNDDIDQITVITKHPHLLNELQSQSDWNCGGCTNPFTEKDMSDRIKIVPIETNQSWNDVDISLYLLNSDSSMTTIISCLGNRQPFIGHWDSYDGNQCIIRSIHKVNEMKLNHKVSFRIVIITSCGINEDWPAMEFFTIGKIAMCTIFLLFARTMYNDLMNMEHLYQKACLDENNMTYLLVRPVGIGDDVIPIHSWILQTEKYKHPLGIEMSKLDVARYMIEEALHPTRFNTAVVIGSDPSIEIQRKKVTTTTTTTTTTTSINDPTTWCS